MGPGGLGMYDTLMAGNATQPQPPGPRPAGISDRGVEGPAQAVETMYGRVLLDPSTSDPGPRYRQMMNTHGWIPGYAKREGEGPSWSGYNAADYDKKTQDFMSHQSARRDLAEMLYQQRSEAPSSMAGLSKDEQDRLAAEMLRGGPRG